MLNPETKKKLILHSACFYVENISLSMVSSLRRARSLVINKPAAEKACSASTEGERERGGGGERSRGI